MFLYPIFVKSMWICSISLLIAVNKICWLNKLKDHFILWYMFKQKLLLPATIKFNRRIFYWYSYKLYVIKDRNLKDKRCFELLNSSVFHKILNLVPSRLKNLWGFNVTQRPTVNNACHLYVPSQNCTFNAINDFYKRSEILKCM